MSTGSFDPDEEETAIEKVPAWAKPKSLLAKDALKSSGRKKFKTRQERKDWDVIEGKASGADAESYLYMMWVKSCIAYWAKVNTTHVIRQFPNLMKYIENESYSVDWISKNRENLLKNRKNVNLNDLLTFKE